MAPSVLTLLVHRIADRLWNRWFGTDHSSPWAEDGRPSTSRLAQIRTRRARILAGVLWPLLRPLLPGLSVLTNWISGRRLRAQLAAPSAPSGQSIAVGNWIIGGGGKTPLAIALALALKTRGLHPALLSRGYRATPSERDAGGASQCRVLQPETVLSLSPAAVGDEAWLMAWRTGCPVGVGADRHAVAQALLGLYPDTNLWILDDGLSQTSLRPDHRLLVLDSRGHGSGRPMPDGPLRGAWPPPHGHSPNTIVAPRGLDLSPILAGLPGPPPDCLEREIVPTAWLAFPWDSQTIPSASPEEPRKLAPETLEITAGSLSPRLAAHGPFLAIAGIAQPEVFFQTLRRLGLPVLDTICLPDHAPEILPSLLRWKVAHLLQPMPSIVMTEKDAVKFAWELHASQSASADRLGQVALLGEAQPIWWAIRLEARLPPAWLDGLCRG